MNTTESNIILQKFSIHLESISKRYDLQWIFRDMDCAFHYGTSYAIRGHNGSGKSTLLRIISSMESPTTGVRRYIKNDEKLSEDKVYADLSFAAPYMGVPDHFTVTELINFHRKFKEMTLSTDELLSDVALEKSKNKRFALLSSGQKQKIKLALAICNTNPLLLLDEPGTNLDDDNYQWFRQKIQSFAGTKLICIATNENRDLDLCHESVVMKSIN